MTKLTDSEQVDELISTLESSLKETVIYLRATILATDASIAEQIKWNSLSFYYTGEMKPFNPKTYQRDIVVCNIHRDKLRLVFPTGAKVTDLLKGKDYPDGRKIISIDHLTDAKAKEKELQHVIRKWLALVE